ncbi:hypothetical protein DN37_1610 [Vibrio cholerae]|nr:hypothetical protein DN37_1610 [Vibrio cholerae]
MRYLVGGRIEQLIAPSRRLLFNLSSRFSINELQDLPLRKLIEMSVNLRDS